MLVCSDDMYSHVRMKAPSYTKLMATWYPFVLCVHYITFPYKDTLKIEIEVKAQAYVIKRDYVIPVNGPRLQDRSVSSQI